MTFKGLSKGFSCFLSAFLAFSLIVPAQVSALPSGEAGADVAAGNVTIGGDGTNMTIDQGLNQKVGIDWDSFNIGAGESVTFIQPGSSALAINRVTGGQISEIFGSLNANGQVWIVNPNGVLFGANSSVNAAGFLASSLWLNDMNPADGKYVFEKRASDPISAIINKGQINTMGDAAFTGSAFRNEGLIKATFGSVYVGASEKTTLEFAGSDICVCLEEAVSEAYMLNENGESVSVLIDNVGEIAASGGDVFIAANVAEELFMSSTVNIDGVVKASSLVADGSGDVYLVANTDIDITGEVESAEGLYIDAGEDFNGISSDQQGDVYMQESTLKINGSSLFIAGRNIEIDSGKILYNCMPFATGTKDIRLQAAQDILINDSVLAFNLLGTIFDMGKGFMLEAGNLFKFEDSSFLSVAGDMSLRYKAADIEILRSTFLHDGADQNVNSSMMFESLGTIDIDSSSMLQNVEGNADLRIEAIDGLRINNSSILTDSASNFSNIEITSGEEFPEPSYSNVGLDHGFAGAKLEVIGESSIEAVSQNGDAGIDIHAGDVDVTDSRITSRTVLFGEADINIYSADVMKRVVPGTGTSGSPQYTLEHTTTNVNISDSKIRSISSGRDADSSLEIYAGIAESRSGDIEGSGNLNIDSGSDIYSMAIAPDGSNSDRCTAEIEIGVSRRDNGGGEVTIEDSTVLSLASDADARTRSSEIDIFIGGNSANGASLDILNSNITAMGYFSGQYNSQKNDAATVSVGIEGTSNGADEVSITHSQISASADSEAEVNVYNIESLESTDYAGGAKRILVDNNSTVRSASEYESEINLVVDAVDADSVGLGINASNIIAVAADDSEINIEVVGTKAQETDVVIKNSLLSSTINGNGDSLVDIRLGQGGRRTISRPAETPGTQTESVLNLDIDNSTIESRVTGDGYSIMRFITSVDYAKEGSLLSIKDSTLKSTAGTGVAAVYMYDPYGEIMSREQVRSAFGPLAGLFGILSDIGLIGQDINIASSVIEAKTQNPNSTDLFDVMDNAAFVCMLSGGDVSIGNGSSISASDKGGISAAVIAGGDVTIADTAISTSSENGFSVFGAIGSLRTTINETVTIDVENEGSIAGAVIVSGGDCSTKGDLNVTSENGVALGIIGGVGKTQIENVTLEGSYNIVDFINGILNGELLGSPFDLGYDIVTQNEYSSALLTGSLGDDVILGNVSSDMIVSFSLDGSVLSNSAINADFIYALARYDIGAVNNFFTVNTDVFAGYAYEGNVYLRSLSDIELGGIVRIQSRDDAGSAPLPIIGAAVASNGGNVFVESVGDITVNKIIAPNGGVLLASENGVIKDGFSWKASLTQEELDAFGSNVESLIDNLMGLRIGNVSRFLEGFMMPVEDQDFDYYSPIMFGLPLQPGSSIVAGAEIENPNLGGAEAGFSSLRYVRDYIGFRLPGKSQLEQFAFSRMGSAIGLSQAYFYHPLVEMDMYDTQPLGTGMYQYIDGIIQESDEN